MFNQRADVMIGSDGSAVNTPVTVIPDEGVQVVQRDSSPFIEALPKSFGWLSSTSGCPSWVPDYLKWLVA